MKDKKNSTTSNIIQRCATLIKPKNFLALVLLIDKVNFNCLSNLYKLHKGSHREREGERKQERERQRQAETETERQRDRETDRQTETERETERQSKRDYKRSEIDSEFLFSKKKKKRPPNMSLCTLSKRNKIHDMHLHIYFPNDVFDSKFIFHLGKQ